jgi:hypothetical protein
MEAAGQFLIGLQQTRIMRAAQSDDLGHVFAPAFLSFAPPWPQS